MSVVFNTSSVSKMAEDIRKVLEACRSSVMSVALFSLGINVLMLAPSLYMLQVYDRVMVSGSGATLLMLSLMMLLLFLAMGGLEWVRSQILVKLTERIDGMLGERLFDVSFRLSLVSGGQQSGAQPLNDLLGLRQFLTGPGFFAFFDAPWMPIYILVLFAFHPMFGLLGVIAALLMVAIAILNERTTSVKLVEAQRESAQAQVALSRTLRNAEVIEALGMLGSLRDKWQKRSRQVIELQAAASEQGGMLISTAKVVRQLMQSAVLGVGAYLLLDGKLSGGMMVAGSIILGRALAPIDQLTSVWKNFITAREQYRRLNDWLTRMPVQPERMPLPPPSGEITAEQVTIVPPSSNKPAIRNLSFRIQPGEVVGVIGPSAAGKSSLARALLGVWPAAQGRIRYDGADAFQWDRAQLGQYVGYLPQDVEMFDGTFAENIARFGEVDSQQVIAAARLAGVHEMILRFPQGYDTVIGSAAGMLTPGQRQRIALARAAYGTPKIVVLDEPNSSLDEQGELALLNALAALKQMGSTVLVISHRASVLPVVDKLMVINDGQLVDFAPTAEVMGRMRERANATQAPRTVQVVS